MWQGFAIFGLLSIIHLLEAKLECYVIGMKSPYISHYAEINHKEHLWSAVLAGAWLTPAVLAAFYFHAYWMLGPLVLSRRVFFDYGLILFMDYPRKEYTGNDWWVRKVFKPVFGKNGRLIELALELLTILFCIIKTVIWN
jgi:hypothetical protein